MRPLWWLKPIPLVRRYRPICLFCKRLILFLFYAIPLFYNFEFDTFTRFISRFGAIISIYYLGQLSFQKIKNIETKFIFFLKYFFSLLCITGLIHATSINFNTETAKINHFTFFFFEYPHSLSIFAVSLFPIFFYYIYNKQVSSYYYLLILGLLPITILFSGAKIGLIVYIVSLTGTIVFTFRKKLSHYLIASIILLTGAIIFINTPVFTELVDVLSVPLDKYIFDTRSYSINSMHTRIKVWSFMIVNLLHEDNLLFGFGWRSWNLKYIALSGAPSSQSDYLTILFDLGLLGIGGFFLVRILILYCFIKEGEKNIKSYYLAIGTLCSLYLGGLTENIEGYPSTSWLIPFFLSLSHYMGNKDKEPDTVGITHPKKHPKGMVNNLGR